MSCDCHSLLSNTKPQICSHIVATVLNGLENLNKETNDEYIDENITINPNITLDISQSRNGYMGMKLNIEGVDSNEYRDIFSSYKNNNRLYRMKNGAYLDLKDKDIEQAFKLIDILNIYNATATIIDTMKYMFISLNNISECLAIITGIYKAAVSTMSIQ